MDDTRTDVVAVDGDLRRTDPGLPPSALVALENSVRPGGPGRGARSMARRLGWLTSVLMLAVVGAAGFLGGVQVQKHQGGTTRVSTAGATGGGGGGAAARAAAGGGTATTVAPGAGATAGTGSGGAGAGAAGAGRRGAGAAAGAGGATPGAAGATPDTSGGAAGAPAAGAGGGAGGRAGVAAAGQVKLIDGANIYVTDGSGNVVKVTTSDTSRITHTGQGTIADIRPGDTVVVQGQKGADGIVAATAVADSGPAAAG